MKDYILEILSKYEENIQDDIIKKIKINKLKNIVENWNDSYDTLLEQLPELLNSVDITDELNSLKLQYIEKLRNNTNEYIYKYVPIYRQINFASAKINAKFIFDYSSDDTVKNNTKTILQKIRDTELWITQIVGKFYYLSNLIMNANTISEIENIYNTWETEYDSVTKPNFIESKDINYIQQAWFNLNF